MFDVDKEIGNRVDQQFALNENFVLWSVAVDSEKVKTEIGDATKTRMEVSTIDKPEHHFECVTLASAIADKAASADDDDFPCIVQLRKVSSKFGNDALVLQWIEDYTLESATR